MTNKEIIFNESMELMKNGQLAGSGEFIQGRDEAGNEIEIELPMEIHTFAGWKALGFKVNRGEHSTIKFNIWKYAHREVETETGETEDRSRMFMTKAFFFTRNQVSEIATEQ